MIVDALALNLSHDEEQEIGRGQTSNHRRARGFPERAGSTFSASRPTRMPSAVADLQRAIELDPDYGRAYAALGLAYLSVLRLGVEQSCRA